MLILAVFVGGGASSSLSSLPNGKTVVYTLTGNTLTKVRDRIGRDILYSYTTQSAFNLSDFGDNGVTISHMNLTQITHPTGAKSQFAYKYLSQKTQYGSIGSYVLDWRKDLNASDAAFNSESYSFTPTYSGGKNHISAATVTKANNVVETHAFNTDGKRYRMKKSTISACAQLGA